MMLACQMQVLRALQRNRQLCFQTRIDIGLDPVYDFDDITSDVDLQDKLRDRYGTVNNIDLWVGGLAEDHIDGSSLGETFQAILVDQFTRLRDGDRFWYENILDGDMVEEIESTTLADVIERNTNLDNLQDNVFFIA
jgi:peroxidase